MVKKQIIIIRMVLLSLGIFGAVGCWNREYFELVGECKKIRLGFTEEQVIKELGAPAKKTIGGHNGRQVRTLMYPAPSLAAMAPYILVDDQSGFVVRVVCDDEYELVDKK
jgi:hypothetical protein